MRCLYCGKQLPLLKKLTGGGEFCSEAHRQKYQEEYNKLALSRLLQTQNADTEAPHRGELVLSSRQHPALQAGRPPLRALEAPKSVDSPLAGNWTPGANRTQRALPPPSNPHGASPNPQQPNLLSRAGADITPPPPPTPVNELPSFLGKPLNRLPLPAPAKPEAKPETSFRFDQPRLEQARLEPKTDQHRPEPSKTNTKRDAFSFRPIDPFPVEEPAPPPPPVGEQSIPPEPAALPAPVALAKPPEPPAAPSEPAEGSFMVEEVRRPEPPPVPKPAVLDADPFTDGRPPKPDGWQRREPEIQAPPGQLTEPAHLFPLAGPPGTANKGDKIQAVGQQEESEQERQEIRKKILENQVKPGDFKQTVPTAPIGPNTVLPICPPAAALDKIQVSVQPKAPVANPSLYLIPAASGEDLWTGWRVSGTAPVRACLAVLAPEIFEIESLAAPARSVANAPVEQAKAAMPSVKLPSAPALKQVSAEAPRNYKAAEALKSAAQTVLAAPPKVEVRQPDKPSTPRHEVFVDLSVLGIEEDEDAEAEYLAGEGESPPGRTSAPRRRRNSAAREAVSELVSMPHPPAVPSDAKLANSFQAPAWKQLTPQPRLRLSSLPLRPKVVFEPSQAPAPVQIPQEVPVKKQLSPLAAEWSAKRLKKVETGAPPSAPGDSGLMPPVETPVSEPIRREAAPKAEIKTTPVEVSGPALAAKAVKAPLVRNPDSARQETAVVTARATIARPFAVATPASAPVPVVTFEAGQPAQAAASLFVFKPFGDPVPRDSAPNGVVPGVTTPVKAAPSDLTAVGVGPGATAPVKTAPIDLTAVGVVPGVTKQVKAPSDITPVGVVPGVTTSVRAVPSDTTLARAVPGVTAPVKAAPIDLTAVGVVPGVTTPVKASSDATPVGVMPVVTIPVIAVPSDTTPARVVPGSAAPVKAAPSNLTPVGVAPGVKTPVKTSYVSSVKIVPGVTAPAKAEQSKTEPGNADLAKAESLKTEIYKAPAMPVKEPGNKESGKNKKESGKKSAIENAKATELKKSAVPKLDESSKTVNAAKVPTPEPLPEKPLFDAPMLGVGATKNGSFWANLPVLPKIALAAGLIAAIGGGAWFTLNPQAKASLTATPGTQKKAQGPIKAGRSLMMNMPGGWSPDWGGDFNRKKNRTISLYRPSANNDDYRMEFEGQVDSKAIGWIYRAVDPKNYFAYKVELVRTGPDPGAALTHFTVVNGVESQKHYSPLAKPIRPGASFRVRLDVRGDEFSAYINDEVVEVWQDDRLMKGGFGLMTELGEVGQIRKLQVYELLP